MFKIGIISPSVRKGRNSHRIAQWLNELIKTEKLGEPSLIDLLEYNFPLFGRKAEIPGIPSPAALDFAEKIRSSDGVIIIFRI
jgi:NAD(P)H-dependent FMN reductase